MGLIPRWDSPWMTFLLVSAPLISPSLPLERRNFGLIFLKWVDSPTTLNRCHAYPLETVSTGSFSPLFGFQLMSSLLFPGYTVGSLYLWLSSKYTHFSVPPLLQTSFQISDILYFFSISSCIWKILMKYIIFYLTILMKVFLRFSSSLIECSREFMYNII